MSKRKKAVATGMKGIAEHAQGLLSATADVAGEKVAEARNRLSEALDEGKEVYGQAWEGAVSRAKATDKFIRENPYAALGLGVALGVLIGFLWRGSDRD
jgi:ElaB/YqjD/DUF883 family membrane-anchored ribosome-binding protein